MQITGRVFLMAVCVFGAYAMPSFNKETTDALVEMLLAQVRTSQIDMRALTPGMPFCTENYNNRTATIHCRLTNEADQCFEAATNMTRQNNQQQNNTTNLIRQNLLSVQELLANCSELTDVPAFLNCTQSTFDSSLVLLDNANTLTYQVQAEIGAEQMQVDMIRVACINKAVSSVKTELMNETNLFNDCLINLSKYRAMNATLLLS